MMVGTKVNILRYVGGKMRALDILYGMLPSTMFKDVAVIVEGFGGGGSFLLNFPVMPSRERKFKYVYNDLDGGLSALFYCLSQEKLYERFVERVRWFLRSAWWLKASALPPLLTDDDFIKGTSELIDAAVRMYFVSHLCYSGRVTSAAFSRRTGQRFLERAKKRGESIDVERFLKVVTDKTWLDLDEIARVHDVISRRRWTVERLDFKDLIANYDTKYTFFYLDPPYYEVGKGLYRCDLSEDDHYKVFELAATGRGMFMISQYDHEKLRSWSEELGLHVWDHDDFGRWAYGMTNQNQDFIPDSVGREIIVTNYDDPVMVNKKRSVVKVSSFFK